MIIATFYKIREHYTSFSITGHAGYAEYGFDIVCASVSSLTIATVKSLITNVGTPCEYDIKKGSIIVSILANNENTDLLVQTLVDGLRDIEDEYPENIKVKIE
ncbi:ribosomal-processing cysteine protease Prp [Vagococcus intermedius]|uniref:Ribosomal processing cysteine protease Prp n=1 Tax=Vagococcus intermedius TaxID=2991418 RepID=A0AAF0CWP7_9ENTE|nr:ribosomal-processing cysteine protease Prp [Vagococcus intermedius]WEG74405.1 ribosomal-processing cysteine protease Prp [Vagococcus intermedius]WEG76525.1 ribosomal-processing cysteine protease Prp [Vagococcus intermedius]